MESSSLNVSTINIDQLRDDNYYTWKHRIQFALSLRDLDHVITEEPPADGDTSLPTWNKQDKKAKSLIALALSDPHLEQVQHAPSAKEMWQLISEIFEKHTLLNRLTTRRLFYTAKMNDNEKARLFAARIRQLASTLKSMNVEVKNNEMAMVLLRGLPNRFNGIISTLDAIADDEKTFTFEFVLSRVEQEERRQATRDEEALVQAETAALVASQKKNGLCKRCKKHPASKKCFWEYLHLAPEWHPARRNMNQDKESAQSGLAMQPSPEKLSIQEAENNNFVCLAAIQACEPNGCRDWIVDSGSTSHFIDNKAELSNYRTITPSSLDLGGGITTSIVGLGDVCLTVQAGSKINKCAIRNVRNVPNLGYRILSVSTTAKRGGQILFDDKGVRIVSNADKSLLAEGKLVRGLYRVRTIPSSDAFKEVALANNHLNLWHQRLAHVYPQAIQYMARHGVVKGLDQISGLKTHNCHGCILGKSHRAIIPKSRSNPATKLLELVHTDVLGPVEVPSVGGSRCLITFIDDFSHWVTEYTMKTKSESLKYFKIFKALQRNIPVTELKVCVSLSPRPAH